MRFVAFASFCAVALAACSGESPAGGPPDDGGSRATSPNDPSGATVLDAGVPGALEQTNGRADAQPALTLDAACTASATAFCASIAQKASDVFAWMFGTVPACEAREKAWCELVHQTPDTGWTLQRATSCTAALAAATIDELIGRPPDACADPPGKRPDGAPCLLPSQCAGRACFAAPGALCGVCGVRRGAQADCTASTDCEDALTCVSGKCAPWRAIPPVGTSCSSSRDCGNVRGCKGTWTWNDAANAWNLSGTCQPRAPAAVGQTCGEVLGDGDTTIPVVALSACMDASCSYASSDATSGACVSRPTVGQACTDEIGCAGLAVCVAGNCAALDPTACK